MRKCFPVLRFTVGKYDNPVVYVGIIKISERLKTRKQRGSWNNLHNSLGCIRIANIFW